MRYTYESIAKQETGSWGYTEKARNAVQAENPRPSRFVKNGNVWENPNAKQTNEATVMIAGDLMCQERYIKAYQESESPENYDFYPSMAHCAEIIQTADLAIGNLEPVFHPEAPYSTEQLRINKDIDVLNRNAPPQFLTALKKCGFDLLTTATNHALDTGLRGLYRTYECLEQMGMIHTGTYIDTEEKHWSLVNVNGIKLGVIDYALFTNFPQKDYITKQAAADTINYYSLSSVKNAVAQLHKNGAEYIICCMNWGHALTHTPTDLQKTRAKALADAGVDLIAGSYPHVLQPYDILTAEDGRKVPVAYSLGNLISHYEQAPRKSSIVLELTLKKDEDGAVSCGVHYIPFYTLTDHDGRKYVTVPLSNRITDISASARHKKSKAIRSVIGSKISKCARFDTPEELSYVVPPSDGDDDFYPFPCKEMTDVQKQLRLTEEYRELYGNYIIDNYPDGESVTNAIRVAKRFLHVDEIDLQENRKLIRDIVYARNVLGFTVSEFFWYDFQDKSIDHCCQFFPDLKYFGVFNKLTNDRESYREGQRILKDKIKAYELLKPFYKREIIKLSGESDAALLSEFCTKHPNFIKKSLDGFGGNSIEICHISDFDSAEDFCRKYQEEMPLVCEELIVSDASFSDIHPQSVNSLRVFTYHDDTDAHILCAWLKAGRGGAVVDNSFSGGMLAAVDERTGVVASHARDEKNNTFEKHPDTGFVFKGYQIPRWDEVVEIVKAAACVLPCVKCIGWDITLSVDKGWQIIEGNGYGYITLIQAATQTGMRQKFLKSIEWERWECNK